MNITEGPVKVDNLIPASYKLTNGDQIVGYVEKLGMDDQGYYEIFFPVSMEVSPEFGLMCRLYNAYTDYDSVIISGHHIVFGGKANKRAIINYNNFMERLNDSIDIIDVDSRITHVSATTKH
ncbi:MAG: hypothetical protein COA84_13295 [Robiginitomaculum sp.]|nr:MAG: hypothetical protein COA84_13295 [Robiginitomaculum sp.]